MRANFSIKDNVYDSSSITTFMRCEKLFYWRDVRGYEPQAKSKALDIGSAIHSAIAAWLKEESWEQALQDELEDKTHFEECLVLMKGYIKKYTGDEYFRNIVTIEREFNVPLLNYPNLSVTGRIDVVVESDEKLLLVEHKTASRSDPNFFSKFRRDIQHRFYAYAVRRLYNRYDGMLVDAIIKKKEPAKGKPDDRYVRAVVLENEMDKDFTEFEYLVNSIHERIKREEYIENLTQCYIYGQCSYLPLCLYGEKENVVDQFKKRGGIK